MKKKVLSILLLSAKTNLLKTLFLGMAFLLYGEVLGQTTIHSDACASATSGWTFTNGTVAQPIQQSGYWLLEDADVITSAAFDVSSYTAGLTLDFQVATYGTGTPNKPCLVEYSLDNGSSWSVTTFTSATPTTSTLIASGTFNIAATSATQFKLRFKKASTGGRQGVRVDNILFQGSIAPPPSNCSGQMTGTYTINPGAAASCTNYQTFASAVSDLVSGTRTDDNSYRHTGGVSGAVTFNVTAGTYTEQITIGTISGTSGTNTVTFKSASGTNTDVVLTNASSAAIANNYTLQINGTDYLRFEDMTISRTGSATYARVIDFIGSASYNIFDGNIIAGRTGSGTIINNPTIACDNTDAGNTNNAFTNNNIRDGYAGIYWLGTSGTRLTNLTITGNTFSNYRYGVYLQYGTAMTVTGNTISVPSSFNGSSMEGLSTSNMTGMLTISKNNIVLTSATSNKGIYLLSSVGDASNIGDISNNMVVVGGSGIVDGINSGSTTSYKNYYYNSVYNTGSNSTSSSAFYLNGSANINLRNNILYSTVGNAIEILAATTLTSDYNDLYSTGTYVGYWTADRTNLAAYQAASSMEANSISADPSFVSTTNLHVNAGSATDAEATVLGITTDIDGQTRNATTPDIGADEYNNSIPSVQLSINTSTGAEGSSSYFTLTATASSAVTGAQTIDVALTGTGLTSGDFRIDADGPGPGAPIVITFPYTLTIANGQTTTSVQLVVIDDATYECIETATFTISNPSAGVSIGSTASQNFTITDNDFPTTDLSINTTTGTEAATTSITLTATASANVIGAQTFSITLSGTNVTNSDFSVSFPQTITIANGATTGTVTFTVADDVLYEGPGTETATFTMAVTSACAANGTTLTQNLVITDNEVAVSSESIVQAVTGSEANTISSLTNGTITSNSDGIQVWRFRLYDGDGSTNDADALPTIYKSWTIQADGVNNTVPDWSTAIADRDFFLNSNTTPIAGGGLTNPANIPFPVSSPYITVPDNGFVDIYMRITLANPLPANSDGKKFAFKLTQADVTVETSASSSQLATFSATSNATKNVIDVTATLQFINAPTTVGLGDAFTITVSAIDANGNIDQNNTSLITLAQNTGTGTMTGGSAANLVAGTYTWTGLTYNTEETFQVIATGGGFSAITANITVTDDDFQLFDHFNRTASPTLGIPSSGGSTAWTETEAGDGTKVQIFSNMLFIDNCVSSDPSGSSGGTTTERVNFNGETYYETIFNNGGGTLNWLFNMRTNNSNLSGFAGSAYGMAFILGCDQADFTASGSDGYAVVVGNSGTTDYIKLVRFTNGLSSDANITDIVASTIDIDANYASVKVSFNPCDGMWTLYARNDGASAFTAPNVSSPAFSGPFTATNTTHTALDLKYFGAAWKHNSSCVGNDTYWDNFYIPNATATVANTKTWNGSVSSNWNTAANWSPCPGVPAITDNVIIPVTANNPIISATPAGLCKDLTVNANAQLTINSGQFLNAHGNIVNNGNVNFGAGTLQLENTPIATVTVTGTINIGNFYNSNNATLAGVVTVTDQARAETGGTLNANGNLVLNNGAQLFHGTGTTVPCACEGPVSGNVVVKRNGTSSATVYNYWSTPIASASLGLLGGTNYLYNPANGTADFTDDNPGPDPGWAAASGSFAVGKGYAGQGPNSAVTFTGTANNGTLNQAVQYFTLVNGSTSPGVPYNLIGNPYPSNISATSFLTANNTKVTGAIYYWDDDITGGTGYAANDYAIWNGTGSTGGGGRTPNGMIATAQGFFVQTLSGATSVSFTNAMRASTATTFFKTEEVIPQRLWLRADNGTHTNQILVGYVDGATEEMDWFYDAQKLRGNHSVSFYSLLNDTTLLGIQGLAPLNGADPAPVPLGLYAGATGQYSIYIDSIENFDAALPINLLDTDMGIVYDLRNGPYVFQTAQGEDNDRFVLFPNNVVTALDEQENLHLNIYPNPNNGSFTVMVNSGIEQQVKISLFDVTGKLVLAADKAISAGNNFIALETQVAGVYMLKVETADKAYNKRVVVY